MKTFSQKCQGTSVQTGALYHCYLIVIQRLMRDCVTQALSYARAFAMQGMHRGGALSERSFCGNGTQRVATTGKVFSANHLTELIFENDNMRPICAIA